MPGECGLVDLKCEVKSAVSDAIQNMADAVMEAVGKALAALSTLWVDVGTPNLTTANGVAPSGSVAFIQNSLWFYMAGAAVLSVIVGGSRMAWERRAEPGKALLRSLLTLVVVSGAGLAVLALAVEAADGFSVWIIDRAVGDGTFGRNIGTMLGLTPAAASGLGPLLVIILGLVAILASFVQIMLMVARAGMLVLLAGILPLSASFTNTEMGQSWFKKTVGWALAFTLYKPAAAIVYATAFKLSSANLFGSDGLVTVLVGLVLMVVALFALPALMRFVVPVVGQLAAGGGGGAGGAAMSVGAMAALPTGAVSVPPMGRSSAGAVIPGPGADPGGGRESGGPGGPSGSGSGGQNRARPAGASAPAATGASGSAAGAKTAAAGAGPAGVAVAAGDGARRVGQAGAQLARGAAENTMNEGDGPSGSR